MKEFLGVLDPAKIKAVPQLACPDASRCGRVLSIGIFFDGTGNNHNHFPHAEDTNIWKLRSSYAADNKEVFAHYVSGVGTPFKEIGKTEKEFQGGATGNGGEARIIYGLLQVINSVHRVVHGDTPRFDPEQLAALCSDSTIAALNAKYPNQIPSYEDARQLHQMGVKRGLVDAPEFRDEFFNKVRNELMDAVTARIARPWIQGIYLDVFGFSRGAAQARVFVSWLFQHLLHGGQLFGVPSCVRMLGLFDTVSSVGLSDSTVVGTGHNDWGNAEDLRIHPKVKNCVHYVALHELRASFPSDSLLQGSTMPDNCMEHLCPGVHSDVGGGYAAGVQGKGVRLQYDRRYDPPKIVPTRSDGLRVSNVPLNAMYDAAVLSTHGHSPRPWRDVAKFEDLKESFGLDDLPEARAAVKSYIDKCGIEQGLDTHTALRRHGEMYLAWRYQVNKRDGFEKLKSVAYAKSLDESGLKYYRQGQEVFATQIAKLNADLSPFNVFKYLSLVAEPSRPLRDWLRKASYHDKASEIYLRVKELKVADESAKFFDEWVHDSYAGFIGKMVEDAYFKAAFKVVHSMAERQGYIRWRQAYQGSTSGVNTSLVSPANNEAELTTA